MNLFRQDKAEKNLDLAMVICPGWGVIQPPVGISYLKGFLEEHGLRVKCFDLSLELYKVFSHKEYWDLNHPEDFIVKPLFEKNILSHVDHFITYWAKQILSHNPKAVGFSLFMSSTNVSMLLARKLKQLRQDLVIIAGGPEVTRIKRVVIDGITEFSPLNIKNVSDEFFNILIDGEGEEALLEILTLIKKKQSFYQIKGALYAQKGQIIVNEPRELIQNLSLLPPPNYHDFDLQSYTRQSLPLVTSRGCINRCAFCADSPLWKKYRYRSGESVIKEIKSLIKEYGRREFEIVDSTFNGDIERVKQICDLIIESKIDIHWSAKVTSREGMTYGLLKRMKEAGCSDLSYGVESGSVRVLKDMHKNINLDEVKRIIKDTSQAGIRVNCFFLIGYPTETEDDFQLTLDFIQKNAEFIHRFDQVTGCHIEEDSYLGLNMDKYGISLKEDGWCSQVSTPLIRKDRLERFKEFARELHKHYKCEVQL